MVSQNVVFRKRADIRSVSIGILVFFHATVCFGSPVTLDFPAIWTPFFPAQRIRWTFLVQCRWRLPCHSQERLSTIQIPRLTLLPCHQDRAECRRGTSPRTTSAPLRHFP